ncbi:MAG: flavodoxin [Propionibacteriaceae bacterium]|jgi:hypothetical protein|nr:flavodoxin [Propionibacteriaceae bacterium]
MSSALPEIAKLVVYFSCTGTTKRIAEEIAAAVGADLCRIEPALPYTEVDLDWHDEHSRSSVEMRDLSSRPAIIPPEVDFRKYQVVFVGAPIWWGVPPTVVNTFLEGIDLSGKTVVPFVTSGSSPVGLTDKQLRASCPGAAIWHPATRIDATATREQLRTWAARYA